MKTPFFLFIALSGLALAQDASIPEPVGETSSPVIMDGALDDAVWKDAAPVAVDYIGSKVGEKSPEPRMIAKYAWDSEYLYIAYETFDSNLTAVGTETKEGPVDNQRAGAEIFKKGVNVDVVEFFISFGDEHFMWEIHQNALNQFNDVLCIVPDPNWPVSKTSLAGPHGIIFNQYEWLANDGQSTVAMAVKLKPKTDGSPSTVNDPSDVDSGYTAEIRLPWRSIGAPSAAATWIENKPAPKTPGPWKMAGQTVNLLAVVQDGDLKERYYHSGPLKKPGWFHKTYAGWPVYQFKGAEEAAIRKQIEELVTQTDAGESSTVLVDSISKGGITAALACTEFLDERKPARSRALYDVISLAAHDRRMNSEILRIYHPAAFDLFYTPEGLANQQKLAAGLAWKEWPTSLPEAVVRAAPLPTLDWLKTQAESPTPDFAKLRLLFNPLGWWLRTENERQYTADFRKVLQTMTENTALTNDPGITSALLKLIADAGAIQSANFVMKQLHSTDTDTRVAAAESFGRLFALPRFKNPAVKTDEVGRKKALDDFIQITKEEKDPLVLAKLAAAAEAWPQDSRVGQAMLELFGRTKDADVQRSILFSVINTRWPERGAILLNALNEPADGVLGVALEAVAIHPSPELTAPVLTLLSEQKDPQPQLIDALGALAATESVPQFLSWLEKEKNPALRLKLIIALNRIPGEASSRALVELLGKAAEPMQADYLCRIASQRQLPGAETVLIALAEDSTAPTPIRARAIWALGNYESPAAHDSLKRLSEKTETYFPGAEGSPLIPEAMEQARLFILLARLRQGDAAASEEVTHRFAESTPATQVAVLLSIAEIKTDSPVIAAGLKSGDFAVLQAAVQAARAANPEKYRPDLETLRKSPFMTALFHSGLETWKLPVALDAALQPAPPTK